MEKIIEEYFEKVKDKVPKEEFVSLFNKIINENKEMDIENIFNDIILPRINKKYSKEELKEEPKDDKHNDSMNLIGELTSHRVDIDIIGRIMAINYKFFINKEDIPKKMCNLKIADDTGVIKAVFWPDNIRLLKNFKEGDIIKLNNVRTKEGFRGLEAHLSKNSTVNKMDEENYPDFPVYIEDITPIADLIPESSVNVIARIKRIKNEREFVRSNGKKGKIQSFDIIDYSGETSYTLFNNDTKLIEEYELNEGDAIKILGARVKEYEGTISLSHWDGRIIKGDFDAPDIGDDTENIVSIDELVPNTEADVVTRIIRISPIRTFVRKDGNEGQVRFIDLQDGTGKIVYTLWNNDVNIIEKLGLEMGDTIKILSAQVREREGEVSISHWDSKIIKGNFDVPEQEINFIKLMDANEEKDVSIIGLVSRIYNTIPFDRDEGTKGYVKKIELIDDTGSIRVTLWDDDTKLEINKGDILKIIGGDIVFDDFDQRGYSYNTNWKSSIIINPDDDDELIDKLKEYALELGPYKIAVIKDQAIDGEFDDGQEVDVRGRIINLSEISDFQREDGTVGLVRSATFADETGSIEISIWDKKTEEELNIGEAYDIENAKVKTGWDDVNLNLNNSSRIIKLDEDLESFVPNFETLEKMIYENKKISDVEEYDSNIVVIARIIDSYDVIEFDRDDGSKGYVKNIEIADNSGSIRVTLWGDDTKKTFELGEAIKLQNPRPQLRETNNNLELNISRNSVILEPNEEELEKLPSYEEIKDIIYKPKTIELLEDDESNIRISGSLSDARGNNILIEKCPNCGYSLYNLEAEDEFICDACGASFDEPKRQLRLSAILNDATGSIPINFYGRNAEELLEMKIDDIIKKIEESGDPGMFEAKIEDFEGMEIEVIANVYYDEYNEESKLSVRKIISKKY